MLAVFTAVVVKLKLLFVEKKSQIHGLVAVLERKTPQIQILSDGGSGYSHPKHQLA